MIVRPKGKFEIVPRGELPDRQTARERKRDLLRQTYLRRVHGGPPLDEASDPLLKVGKLRRVQLPGLRRDGELNRESPGASGVSDEWGRPSAVDEQRFWRELARSINVEINASGRDELIGLYEDGIAASAFVFDSNPVHVEGQMWFLGEQAYRFWGPYHFVVDLSGQPNATSREDLDFEALLPRDGVTGWLTMDLTEMRIVIDPASAEEPAARSETDGYRSLVHGAGPPEETASNRGSTHAGAIRHERRTGKRRPPPN